MEENKEKEEILKEIENINAEVMENLSENDRLNLIKREINFSNELQLEIAYLLKKYPNLTTDFIVGSLFRNIFHYVLDDFKNQELIMMKKVLEERADKNEPK